MIILCTPIIPLLFSIMVGKISNSPGLLTTQYTGAQEVIQGGH